PRLRAPRGGGTVLCGGGGELLGALLDESQRHRVDRPGRPRPGAGRRPGGARALSPSGARLARRRSRREGGDLNVRRAIALVVLAAAAALAVAGGAGAATASHWHLHHSGGGSFSDGR